MKKNPAARTSLLDEARRFAQSGELARNSNQLRGGLSGLEFRGLGFIRASALFS